MNIHPFPPSSYVDMSGPYAVLAAPIAGDEPPVPPEGSMLSYDAAGAQAWRGGWLHVLGGGHGGERMHHRRR